MSAAFVKSLTRQIEERMGSGAKAAAAAGVSQGRWSDYVNDTNPIHGETTIPLHRFMKVAGPDEKSALLSVWSQDFATPGDCLNTEASQVTEASAELQRVVREAKARAGEGPISQIDQARILKLVLMVHAEVQRMAERAESMGNIALAAQLFEQAAKEAGDSYTNRRELTGKNGAPLPAAAPAVVMYQLPDNGRG